MRLSKTKTEVREHKEFAGLFVSDVTHEIKSSKGEGVYCGPKIPALEWQQVLSFFRWTNDTMKSESQVRMYVNAREGQIRFWAHPQEARTGMSARELEQNVEERNADTLKRFASWGVKPSGGWILLGTVHHHCSSGAFQSGVDENNEKGQDGLHITVGDMDKNKHDLHARFYQGGYRFEPDMNEFWDIGEPWSNAPDGWCDRDAIARFQMTISPPKEFEFPKEWRDNIIEKKYQATTYGDQCGFGYGGHGYRREWCPGDEWDQEAQEWKQNLGGNGKSDKKTKASELKLSSTERAYEAAKLVEAAASMNNFTAEEIIEALDNMCAPVELCILNACVKWDVDPEDIYREIETLLVMQEQKEIQKQLEEDSGSVTQ